MVLVGFSWRQRNLLKKILGRQKKESSLIQLLKVQS